MSGEQPPKSAQKRYEMLWDCEYCGTAKLLGKSHRHCPKCGAPQDASRRYFPSESEKVAVEDHVYHGADRVCDACATPNSAAAAFCVNCGAPTEEAAEVARVGAPAASAGAAQPAGAARLASLEPGPVRPRSRRGCLAAVGGVVAILTALFSSLCWTREATFEVAGHAWERRISLERFQTVSESGWRDSVPGDARQLSCSREQRGAEQVPDGETCSTVNVDDGDGTFHQEEQCSTRYRSEPVYDDRCSWEADRWRAEPERVARGADLSPSWPLTGFAPCQGLGCRREAGREARYELKLRGADGAQESCDVPEQAWRNQAVGARLQGRVRVVTGGLVCGSLDFE